MDTSRVAFKGVLATYRPALVVVVVAFLSLLLPTMSSGAALDIVDAATANYPAIEKGLKEETILE